MQAAVVGQLGMEGHGEDVALAHRDGVAVHLGEHLHLVAVLLDPRRADEDGAQRPDPVELEVGLEAVQLAAEGVAARASRRAARGGRGRA